MAKVRSPVLGFNHNVKHLGWVFHVQTEDSGVQNPHLFTHLFHGGVIISTKKVVYDASAEPDVVKGLMQAQHKAMLKELKGGVHDEKIQRYLKDVPKDGDEPPLAHVQRNTPAPLARPSAEITVEMGPNTGPQEPLLDLEAGPPGLAVSVPVIAPSAPTIPQQVAPVVPPAPPPRAMPLSQPPPLVPEAQASRSQKITVPTEPSHVEFRAPRAKAVEPTAADVSAAFRAMSSATRESARIPTQLAQAAAQAAGLAQPRTVQTLKPPALQQDGEEPLDIEIGHLPTPPPGAGVWSSKPREIAQERPFDKDKSGAVRIPEGMPPPRGQTSAMGSVAAPSFRPAVERQARPTNAPPQPPRPPTMPPPVQGRPAPRLTPAHGSAAPASQPPVPAPPLLPPSVPQAASPTPSSGIPRPVAPSPSGATRRNPPVVVARPAVIVGAPPQTTAAARRVRDSVSGETFGKDLISERSLDEVIMQYLSEDGSEE